MEANKKVVEYLDVTFDHNTNSDNSYMKPNSPLLYVNSDSNHPPCILRNIPISVNKRLADLSSSEEIFRDSVKEYQSALDKCGYKHKLEYSPTPRREYRRNRQRNIVWFNPPWSKNVKTDIGKSFFKLLEKHFPENHILRPIINRNKVKLSYSCMANVNRIIASHNKRVLVGGQNEPQECDCENQQCPVDGLCKSEGVVYQATVMENNATTDSFIGLTERRFINRYNEHYTNFKTRNPKNSTKLSKKILKLRDQKKIFEIKWEIGRE